jgi:putative aminopeptidase FrvX
VTLGAQSLAPTPVARAIVEERLKQYAGDNRVREDTLKKLFEKAGCTGDRLAEQPVRHSKNPNVLCTLPASAEASANVIIVGAHFDRVDIGQGVVDNWSSASLLSSLFQSLLVGQRRHTFLFIGFTDEEKGLVGSRFYVKQLSNEQKQSIHAMVNMDTLGLSFTRTWPSHSDPQLLKMLLTVANGLHAPIGGVNVDNLGSTDSESFRDAGIPSLTIHSVTRETWPILHTNRDRIEQIHMDEYYETYRLMAAYLAYLDTKLD